MKPNIDWEIHGCANGVVCDIDGKTENGYMPGTCKARQKPVSLNDIPWFGYRPGDALI